ncbi:hypothetical protein [Deinococcus sp. RM]|uniref:hypothetical protein n=1 Tax=Deinococcus sp. RM TaxID=2316359 RepID=UPI003AB61BCA
MKWTVLMTAFVLTSCTGDIRMGKTWTAQELLDLADRTLGTQAAVARIECRRPAEAGSLKACYVVNGPAGTVRKPLDDGLQPDLKLLGDWSFTSGTASATYQTQTGQKMNLSVVYGANDGYTLLDEDVPAGQGTLHVYAAPATP